MSDLGIAILSGSGAMLGWGAADFFAKRSIDDVGDFATLFWGQCVGAAALCGAVLAGGRVPAIRLVDLLGVSAFGVVSAYSYLLLYRGFGRGKISVLSPLFASYAAVAVVVSALAFGETVPEARWLAVLVVFIGIVLLTGAPGDGIATSGRRFGGLPEVAGAMLVFAWWIVLWDRFIQNRDWLPMLACVRLVAVAALGATALARHVDFGVRSSETRVSLVLVGACDAAAFALLSLGLHATSMVSVVAMLSGAFSLPTIVLARLFLDERLTRRQLLAASLVIVGIGLLAVV
jgi:drug/metabolite transporter (DMT)-like permease